MGDDHQAFGSLAGALQRLSQVVRVESAEAFVEQDQLAALQQRPRKIEPAALAVRELPALSP